MKKHFIVFIFIGLFSVSRGQVPDVDHLFFNLIDKSKNSHVVIDNLQMLSNVMRSAGFHVLYITASDTGNAYSPSLLDVVPGGFKWNPTGLGSSLAQLHDVKFSINSRRVDLITFNALHVMDKNPMISNKINELRFISGKMPDLLSDLYSKTGFLITILPDQYRYFNSLKLREQNFSNLSMVEILKKVMEENELLGFSIILRCSQNGVCKTAYLVFN